MWLKKEVYLWLKRQAKEKDTSVSQIIREAVDEYLKIRKKK
ncbi:ribbon-helix-helix protein, CopG family [Candidatus Gottesmanbacteria bacterium]|nr:ribbon-helix-helix protein, CopG family [Candidatus Gottesmanbacteria bacterium]